MSSASIGRSFRGTDEGSTRRWEAPPTTSHKSCAADPDQPHHTRHTPPPPAQVQPSATKHHPPATSSFPVPMPLLSPPTVIALSLVQTCTPPSSALQTVRAPLPPASAAQSCLSSAGPPCADPLSLVGVGCRCVCCPQSSLHWIRSSSLVCCAGALRRCGRRRWVVDLRLPPLPRPPPLSRRSLPPPLLLRLHGMRKPPCPTPFIAPSLSCSLTTSAMSRRASSPSKENRMAPSTSTSGMGRHCHSNTPGKPAHGRTHQSEKTWRHHRQVRDTQHSHSGGGDKGGEEAAPHGTSQGRSGEGSD